MWGEYGKDLGVGEYGLIYKGYRKEWETWSGFHTETKDIVIHSMHACIHKMFIKYTLKMKKEVYLHQVYAPQQRCTEEEKRWFIKLWAEVDRREEKRKYLYCWDILVRKKKWSGKDIGNVPRSQKHRGNEYGNHKLLLTSKRFTHIYKI